MRLLSVEDPCLPGLAHAGDRMALNAAMDAALAAATGGAWRCNRAGIERFRYRAGKRAILQMSFDLSSRQVRHLRVPGALWLFGGDKAAKADPPPGTASELPAAVYDPATRGLVTLFPHDRRAPGISEFVSDPAAFATRLIGTDTTATPRLVRYRVGMGATFRWVVNGCERYVKVFNDRSAAESFESLSRLADLCSGTALGTPVPSGFNDRIGAVATDTARGRPLGDILRDGSPSAIATALDTTLNALAILNALPVRPARTRDSSDLLQRAVATVDLVRAIDPRLGAGAADVLADLARRPPELAALPVHMDMKIEHVLVDGPRAELLDLDSMALSDPLFDVAMLTARIETARIRGQISAASCRAACSILAGHRSGERERFDWLHRVACLQTLRFLVQNPRRDWRRQAAEMLDVASGRARSSLSSD